MDTAKSAVMHFSLADDGIVLAESQPDVQPTAKLLMEAEEACRRVRGDVKRPALWDIRQLAKPKPEAWVGFIQNAPNNLTAIAIVGNADQMNLLGAFPRLMNELLLPIGMFEESDAARRWLARYV